MTQYAGGKARIGNRISDVIIKYESEVIGHNESPYLEPFVGMAGVLTRMTVKTKERKFFACDSEKSIISFWREIQNGSDDGGGGGARCLKWTNITQSHPSKAYYSPERPDQPRKNCGARCAARTMNCFRLERGEYKAVRNCWPNFRQIGLLGSVSGVATHGGAYMRSWTLLYDPSRRVSRILGYASRP